MKKYTHKSGKYIATVDMYGFGNVTLLKGFRTDQDREIYSIPTVCRELIEESNDWVEMVEVPVGLYYSKLDVELALREALGDIRIQENLAEHYFKLKFEESFFHYLELEKKK